MAEYYIGLDLGQAADYTALAVAERHSDQDRPFYHIRHLQRFRLGTSYPEIVARVKTMMQTPDLHETARLIVDATGVGRPVVEMLEMAYLAPISITITGGDKPHREGNHWRVPKRDLVSTMQVLLQANRLKVAEALPEAATLVKELLNFKVRIDPQTAHDSYAVWREGVHDDLVLAVALAVWYAERGRSWYISGDEHRRDVAASLFDDPEPGGIWEPM